MTSKALEAAALALARKNFPDRKWTDLTDDQKTLYLDEAKIAIHDIDRRLDALETNARQMGEIDACQSVLNGLKDRVAHASDCAVNNAPAYPPGPCNCKGGAAEKTRESGWYWVKLGGSRSAWVPCEYLANRWYWGSGPAMPPPPIIGPRIQEPSE